jgi:hypothetical protein
MCTHSHINANIYKDIVHAHVLAHKCEHTVLTYIHALTQQRKGMCFAHW